MSDHCSRFGARHASCVHSPHIFLSHYNAILFVWLTCFFFTSPDNRLISTQKWNESKRLVFLISFRWKHSLFESTPPFSFHPNSCHLHHHHFFFFFIRPTKNASFLIHLALFIFGCFLFRYTHNEKNKKFFLCVFFIVLFSFCST